VKFTRHKYPYTVAGGDNIHIEVFRNNDWVGLLCSSVPKLTNYYPPSDIKISEIPESYMCPECFKFENIIKLKAKESNDLPKDNPSLD
jgi:hypothetical protein